MSDPHNDAEPLSPVVISQSSQHSNEPLSPSHSSSKGFKKGKKKHEEAKDKGPKWEGEYTGAMVDGETHMQFGTASCLYELVYWAMFI